MGNTRRDRREVGATTGRPVVGYTGGVYDMFHIGHLNVLQEARSRCDHLVVGVCTDELVVTYKGKRPVVPFDERIQIVASMRGVDEVYTQTSVDKVTNWRDVRFDRLFTGDDHRGQPEWVRYEAALAPFGVEVVYFPYTLHTSSTLLRERLLALPAPA